MHHLPKGLTKRQPCQGLSLTMKITMGYFIFVGYCFSFVNHANRFSIMIWDKKMPPGFHREAFLKFYL